MPSIFHNIPRDGETVAAVRKGCTAKGWATTCRDRQCRRARRCRAPWRASADFDDLVLPPCLEMRWDMTTDRLAEAQVALTDLRLIVAEARRVPDPDYVAEFAEFDAAAVKDAADDAPWA